ncbi:hypothetical protein V1519DRAFT_456633 [Lipomyces tetrasporus]
MFLWTMNEGASNRVVQEMFSHSGETVSRCFHEVLDALLQLYKETVRLPKESTPLASRIPYRKICELTLTIYDREALAESLLWQFIRGTRILTQHPDRAMHLLRTESL